MTKIPADRLAETRVPIHHDLAARWSPRMFDADAAIEDHQLVALLEAARWAATWGNRQPVRFVVGVRGDATFDRLANLLKRGNAYAKASSALILVCADEGEDERTALYACVDAGAAIAQLTIEAVSRSMIAHPMAGFDVAGAREEFGIPAEVRPLAMIAVGVLGDYAQASPEIVERDSTPRTRLPLAETVFTGSWGTPLPL